MSSGTDLDVAYAHCESVTRQQAANFYYGIRLLPKERRRAMCAAYAFARRIDDIGDGSLQHEEKLRRLDAQALALAALERAPSPGAARGRPATRVDGGAGERARGPVGAGAGGDLILTALGDAHARFSLPPGALGELIEGVRMDVEGVSYERFEELVLYCRRVAGAIGRVCVAIFGLRGDATTDMAGAEALADDLGVALQLTNILRDVAEDATNGRVYLPREDLRRFGLIPEARGGTVATASAPDVLAAIDPPGAVGDGDGGGRSNAGSRMAELVHFEAERARRWFERGLALVPLLDRRSAACVLAMAGIYRRLLDRIDAHPEQAMRARISLPGREKAWVAARGMLTGGGGWA